MKHHKNILDKHFKSINDKLDNIEKKISYIEEYIKNKSSEDNESYIEDIIESLSNSDESDESDESDHYQVPKKNIHKIKIDDDNYDNITFEKLLKKFLIKVVNN